MLSSPDAANTQPLDMCSRRQARHAHAPAFSAAQQTRPLKRRGGRANMQTELIETRAGELGVGLQICTAKEQSFRDLACRFRCSCHLSSRVTCLLVFSYCASPARRPDSQQAAHANESALTTAYSASSRPAGSGGTPARCPIALARPSISSHCSEKAHAGEAKVCRPAALAARALAGAGQGWPPIPSHSSHLHVLSANAVIDTALTAASPRPLPLDKLVSTIVPYH